MGHAAATAVSARTRSFLILYAIATAGSVIAYSPFLVLVLPGRVSVLAGGEDVRWLGLILLAGSIAASIGGVAVGMASDWTRRRRIWIGGGLVATVGLLPVLGRIDTIALLLVTVMVWQVALNSILIPLAAWAADRMQPDQAGRLGGWLALAPVVGAWSGLLLAGVNGQVADRLWLVALLAAAMIAPILLSRDGPTASPPPIAPTHPPVAVARRMWAARLLVQVAAGGPASYLVFWLRSVDPKLSGAQVTTLFALGLTAAAALAMLLGRSIDRHGRPLRMLAATAIVAGAGLAAMAADAGVIAAVMAYLLFATASAAFLALHSGQTLRILPDPRRHGRHIGVFNLTNTLPTIVVPMLAIGIIPRFGYSGLCLVSAGLCLVAAAILASGTAQRTRTGTDRRPGVRA